MDLSALQNGSDIRGVAAATPTQAPNLTEGVAQRIGAAFAAWLKEEKGIIKAVVSIGRDPRLSGESLSEGLVKGLYAGGAHSVYDFGVCSTPAMYVSTEPSQLDCDAAVMVTASHLPPERNGFKFFTKEGGLSKDDVKAILLMAGSSAPPPETEKAAVKMRFLETYAKLLVDMIRQETASMKPLAGLKIIVDAGNGSGGFFCPKVLEPLGADTAGSVCLEPDGEFPVHIPNPENSEVMRGFCQAVSDAGADLGVIFDTDVDRAALVDRGGVPIGKSRLIALVSDMALRDSPGAVIVTDSVTSGSLGPYIEERGGVHYRYMRGYSNVISEARRLDRNTGNCALAIETSGHCALKENGFLDDGAYLVVKLLIYYSQLRKSGSGFANILEDYRDPAEELEQRFEITSEDYRFTGMQALSDFEKFAHTVEGWAVEEPNYEGVRVSCGPGAGNGWLLLRMSLHDPQLAANIESDEAGGAGWIAAKLHSFLKRYKKEIKVD
jgi:phosphomannomutase